MRRNSSLTGLEAGVDQTAVSHSDDRFDDLRDWLRNLPVRGPKPFGCKQSCQFPTNPPSDMVRRAGARVTGFLLDKVGDGLRAVVILRPGEFEMNYLAKDLKKCYSWETFSVAETILISVTQEVGRDLLGFIEDCPQLVHGESAG